MDTIVFGIDGGEWNVIDPLLEAGALPNLSRLLETGVRGDLASTTPPVSPPAWNSIHTGTNPGKHGVYDFSSFDERYRRRSVSSADRQATPFWRVMNDHGVETGLFKPPFTYPPDEVDGFFVTGFPTPDSADDYAYPPAVGDAVGESSRLFESYRHRDAGEYEKFKQNLLDVAEHQTDVLLDVLDDTDPAFLMTVFDGSDRLQHFFWKYVDESHPRYESDPALSTAFREYFEVVDEGIGRVLDRAGPETNVLVISDHGFEKLSYDVYVDEWLEAEGYLSRGDPASSVGYVQRQVGALIKSSWDVAERVGIDAAIERIVPAPLFERGRETALQNPTHRLTDWERTSAFFTTLSGQSIYVNLEDRFAEGTVSEQEYDEVVSSLREGLLGLTHPETGERLVADVHRGDEVYDGWAVDRAPDLVVNTVTGFTMKGGWSDSLVQSSTQEGTDRSGDHRETGVLVASGPAFTTGTVEEASILDVAPTLLYLHNCPVPRAVDGEVLTELFTAEAAGARELDRTDDYGQVAAGEKRWSHAEEQELEDRLSDMGYL